MGCFVIAYPQIPAQGMTMIEEELWQNVRNRSPKEVAVCAMAEYDGENRTFGIRVMNDQFRIDVDKKVIFSPDPVRKSHFLPLFLLHHLTYAKDIPLSNMPVSPNQLTGGTFFFRASHELPLPKIAAKFDNNLEKFLEKGKKLGGELVDYGDAAVKVHLLPRVPLIFVLWKKDEEFESQVHLILDKSIEEQMSLEGVLLALLYAIGKWVED
jgi:hypothetical protein